MMRKRVGGFTLIELMIVVGIVGILAAIGYPQYRGQITKSARAGAQTELLQLANQQEKIYLNSSSYAVSITTAYNGTNSGGLGITNGLTSDGRYTLTITPTTGTTSTYTITATPVAGSSQVGDGNLTISSAGTRTWGTTTW